MEEWRVKFYKLPLSPFSATRLAPRLSLLLCEWWDEAEKKSTVYTPAGETEKHGNCNFMPLSFRKAQLDGGGDRFFFVQKSDKSIYLDGTVNPTLSASLTNKLHNNMV